MSLSERPLPVNRPPVGKKSHVFVRGAVAGDLMGEMVLREANWGRCGVSHTECAPRGGKDSVNEEWAKKDEEDPSWACGGS